MWCAFVPTHARTVPAGVSVMRIAARRLSMTCISVVGYVSNDSARDIAQSPATDGAGITRPTSSGANVSISSVAADGAAAASPVARRRAVAVTQRRIGPWTHELSGAFAAP